MRGRARVALLPRRRLAASGLAHFYMSRDLVQVFGLFIWASWSGQGGGAAWKSWMVGQRCQSVRGGKGTGWWGCPLACVWLGENIRCFKKFWKNLWMFTRHISITPKKIIPKFKMHTEKQEKTNLEWIVSKEDKIWIVSQMILFTYEFVFFVSQCTFRILIWNF